MTIRERSNSKKLDQLNIVLENIEYDFEDFNLYDKYEYQLITASQLSNKINQAEKINNAELETKLKEFEEIIKQLAKVSLSKITLNNNLANQEYRVLAILYMEIAYSNN